MGNIVLTMFVLCHHLILQNIKYCMLFMKLFSGSVDILFEMLLAGCMLLLFNIKLLKYCQFAVLCSLFRHWLIHCLRLK